MQRQLTFGLKYTINTSCVEPLKWRRHWPHSLFRTLSQGEEPALTIYLDWTEESFPDWKDTTFLIRRGGDNEILHLDPGHSHTLSAWESQVHLIVSVSGACGDNLVDLALAYDIGARILVTAGLRLDSFSRF